jgi:hypothetical protein
VLCTGRPQRHRETTVCSRQSRQDSAKSSGLTFSRNFRNSSTTSCSSSGSPPNSIAESSITWSATKIGALVRTANASASDGLESTSISEPFTCSEVLGAYGWLNDHPLARFIALAKMLQVVDGTAEVQRLVIARDLDRQAGRL